MVRTVVNTAMVVIVVNTMVLASTSASMATVNTKVVTTMVANTTVLARSARAR